MAIKPLLPTEEYSKCCLDLEAKGERNIYHPLPPVDLEERIGVGHPGFSCHTHFSKASILPSLKWGSLPGLHEEVLKNAFWKPKSAKPEKEMWLPQTICNKVARLTVPRHVIHLIVLFQLQELQDFRGERDPQETLKQQLTLGKRINAAFLY